MGKKMSRESVEDLSEVITQPPESSGAGPSGLYPTTHHLQFPTESADKIGVAKYEIALAEKNQDYNKCLELLENLPKTRQILLLRAKYLVLNEQFVVGNEVLKEVFRESPTNAEAIALLGFIFYHQGNLKMSVEVFKNALEFNPELELAKTAKENATRLHRILRSLPDEESPIHEFTSFVIDLIEVGLKVDPTNKIIRKKLQLHLTRANFKIKEYSKTIDIATEALKLDDQSSLLFMYRARAYMALEIYDDAIIDLLEVAKFNECPKIAGEMRQMRRIAGQSYNPPTHYDFLTIQRSATEDEINQTFDSMSLLHRVNLAKAATDSERRKLEFKFKRVAAAHAILSNTKLRKKYDSGLDKEAAKVESSRRRQERRGKFFDFFCGSLGRCFSGCISCMCECGSVEDEELGLISGHRRPEGCVNCISEVIIILIYFCVLAMTVALIVFVCWTIASYSYWAFLAVLAMIAWGCKACRSTM